MAQKAGMPNGALTGPASVALEACGRNAHGHRTGEFEPWYAMLTDDVVISMPLGPFRGHNHGIAAAREIYGAVAADKPRLVYAPPLRVSHNGTTVVVEFNDHGTIAGFQYRNHIAALFDVRGDRIAGYREYFGDIDPDVVRLMSGQGAPAHD